MSHHTLIKLANLVLALAIVLGTAAFAAAFVYDQHLSIPQQILGHTGILLSVTMLKIGYVVRLTGLRKQQLSEISA